MTDNSSERQFVSRIRAALEQSAEKLEPGVRSRLTRMRHEVLARQTDQPPRNRTWRWFSGVAAAATMVALIVLLPIGPRDGQTPLAVIDDMEMLASNDPFEIYEDMEFYSWLSDMENEIENG